MKRLNWIFLFVLIFLVSLKSYAGLHIEPWVGYALSGGDDSSDVTGPAAGLRAGFSTLGFEFGGEYFQAQQDLSVDGTDTDIDFEQSGMGAFVGFNPIAIPLRIYGTYFFESEVTLDPSVGIPGLFTIDEYGDGSGYKLGVGFTGLPFLSLNIEWQSITYDTVSINGTEFELTDGGEYETILFTVSVPLP